MNHKLRTALIAFALVGGLAACDNDRRDAATAPNSDSATAQKNDNATAPNSGSSITEPNRTSQGMSGSELEKAVKSKLESDEQLRSAGIDVSADAEKNAVTLSGNVPSEAARSKALELAKSAHAGITVNDKIEVKPAA